jgi:hypothetical protein
MNAVERFEDNIKEIDRDIANIIPITSMTYDIDQLIRDFLLVSVRNLLP